MEIECKGCYYTVCSFICLTENLSEILQFLWKHGCLRKSYFCEKCGRKCAVGDKDLFFRCNRNTLDTPLTSKKSLPSQSQSSGEFVTSSQTTSQMQPSENGQLTALPQNEGQITALPQNEVSLQYVIPQPDSSQVPQESSDLPNQNIKSENLLLENNDYNFQNIGIVKDENSESEKILFLDYEGSDIFFPYKNTDEKDHNLTLTSSVQVPSQNLNPTETNTSLCKSESQEPPAKVLKVLKTKKAVKNKKQRCNFKMSMKKGTFFEKSKLPMDTVCKFIVFWCCMKHPTQEFFRNELSLSTKTVVDWCTACREICILWAKSVSQKIGGNGVVVNIDEVKLNETKNIKQIYNGMSHAFWGLEKAREKGKLFIVPVSVCNAESLLNVINEWILPGSIIVSSCWKTYDCFKSQDFVQQTLKTSKTCVHPQNDPLSGCQVKVEEDGDIGGEFQTLKYGTRRSHHLGDLAAFMFKRRYGNHLERIHVFFKQISKAYPLHE